MVDLTPYEAAHHACAAQGRPYRLSYNCGYVAIAENVQDAEGYRGFPWVLRHLEDLGLPRDVEMLSQDYDITTLRLFVRLWHPTFPHRTPLDEVPILCCVEGPDDA